MKPKATAAAPASVARPRPRHGPARRHPTSTAGRIVGQEMRHGESRPPDHGPARPVDQPPRSRSRRCRSAPAPAGGTQPVSSFDIARRSGYHQNDSSAWRAASSSRSVGTKGRRTSRGSSASECRACPRSGPVSRAGARARRPGTGRGPAGRSARRAGPVGTTARPGRRLGRRPPRPRPHPSRSLVMWATNSQDAPRRRVPSTWTGSPGRRPAQRVVRRKSATAAAGEDTGGHHTLSTCSGG